MYFNLSTSTKVITVESVFLILRILVLDPLNTCNSPATVGGGVKIDGFKSNGVVVTVVCYCMVSARFGEGLMINGFKGVEVVTAVTTVGCCIAVGKLSSRRLEKLLFVSSHGAQAHNRTPQRQNNKNLYGVLS